MSQEIKAHDEPAESETEYERFQRLTQRLLKVPKSELDAKREPTEPQPRTT